MKFQFGSSFNPEHWIFDNDIMLSRKAFRILIEDLKIKDIRLSIRSSEVLVKNTIDLSYYDYFISKAIKTKSTICLNIGPIKTMRWPEETISNVILGKLKKFPEHGEAIDKDSELAKRSLDYLDKLLTSIKKKYGDSISVFQTNNEAFNHFGQYGWIMDEEFEYMCIQKIFEFFPQCRVMINSSGRQDLKKIVNLIRRFDNISNFIIGINYYYLTPGSRNIPLFGIPDNLQFKRGEMRLGEIKRISNESNVPLEISEFQFEPWPPYDSPGNSFREFEYQVNKTKRRMKGLNQEQFVIRLWGIEELVVKIIEDRLTKDHQEIISLITGKFA